MTYRMSALQTQYPPDPPWELVIPTWWHESGSCVRITNRRWAACQVILSGCLRTWHGYSY